MIPGWLYRSIPIACLVAGMGALLVLDGRESTPAWLAVWYGGAVLVIRVLSAWRDARD